MTGEIEKPDLGSPVPIDLQSLPPGTKLFLHQEYHGPVPRASEMAKYEEVLPGSADRIISMAEREQTGQLALQERTLDAEIADRLLERRERRWGQGLGTTVVLAALGATVYLGTHGAEGAAKVLGGTVIVGLAAVFVIGRLIHLKGPSDSN